MGAIFCFFPSILMSSTKTDRNNTCFRWANMRSQFDTLSHPISNIASSNCLSQRNLAKGCPYKFRSQADTASAACPPQPGNLAIPSTCLLRQLPGTQTSLAQWSLRKLQCCLLQHHHKARLWQKGVSFCLIVLPVKPFALDVFKIPCWNCLKFFHPSSSAAVASGIFIAWCIRINLCTKYYGSSNKILCLQCGLPGFWTVKIMLLVSWIHEIPLFNHTLFSTPFSLTFFGFAFEFSMLGCLLLDIARATGLSNFLSCIIENLFVFFVVKIDKVNFPQSSGIVVLWFLFCPFLIFSILIRITDFRPNLRTTWIMLEVSLSME